LPPLLFQGSLAFPLDGVPFAVVFQLSFLSSAPTVEDILLAGAAMLFLCAHLPVAVGAGSLTGGGLCRFFLEKTYQSFVYNVSVFLL
jgi:hypothetical protein